MKITFDDIVTERIAKIRSILVEKAKEYAKDTDRYHNFNIAGRILNTTPEKALIGMWMKHVVSVLDLVDWADILPDKLSTEIIDEKIGDAINYLILLEGMLKEGLQEEV